MPGWTRSPPTLLGAAGGDISDSSSVAITTTAEDTKTGFVELLAATEDVVSGFAVIYQLGGDFGAVLMDIAIGAAGSEVVIWENIRISCWPNTDHLSSYFFMPLAIPAGERISARLQTKFLPGTSEVGILLQYGNRFIPANFSTA